MVDVFTTLSFHEVVHDIVQGRIDGVLSTVRVAPFRISMISHAVYDTDDRFVDDVMIAIVLYV